MSDEQPVEQTDEWVVAECAKILGWVEAETCNICSAADLATRSVQCTDGLCRVLDDRDSAVPTIGFEGAQVADSPEEIDADDGAQVVHPFGATDGVLRIEIQAARQYVGKDGSRTDSHDRRGRREE